MQLKEVDKTVLFNYYEKSYGLYGKFPIPEEAYQTDKFYEYAALKRIIFPKLSDWKIAKNSKRPDFLSIIEKLEPDVIKKKTSLPGWHAIRKSKIIDFKSIILPGNIASLLVDRCIKLKNLYALKKYDDLNYISLIRCQEIDQVKEPVDILVDTLRITECGKEVISNCLEIFSSARFVEIFNYENDFLDLRKISNFTNLIELKVEHPLIKNHQALYGLPIRDLYLRNVLVSKEFFVSISENNKSLENLNLGSIYPFGPEIITNIPEKLSFFSIPGFPEFREQWIDWAVNNSHINCIFYSPEASEFPAKTGNVSVEEFYRNFALLKVKKGKSVYFEISEDVTSLLENKKSIANNNQIEDTIRVKASKLKKNINWSSEADMFVAQSKDIKDLYWIIDEINIITEKN